MIALLLAAAVLASPVNCRPRDLFRHQAGQACITSPTIAPAHVEAARRQLKQLMKSQGQLDPELTARIQAEVAKSMASKGIRHRYGPAANLAPFRKFESGAAPKVSPYTQ